MQQARPASTQLRPTFQFVHSTASGSFLVHAHAHAAKMLLITRNHSKALVMSRHLEAKNINTVFRRADWVLVAHIRMAFEASCLVQRTVASAVHNPRTAVVVRLIVPLHLSVLAVQTFQ